MEPEENIDPLIHQYDINVHNLNLDYDSIESIAFSTYTFQTLLFTPHGSLLIYFLDQPIPSPFASDALDFQFVGPNGNQVHGGCISQKKEKNDKDTFYHPFIFQIPLCTNDALTFSIDKESYDLDNYSN